MKKTAGQLAAISAVVSSPAAALACPVCFNAASGKVLEAYYLTTVMLIVVPIALLGSIGAWLYRASVRAASGSDQRE